jgi:ABC-type multidrug transport system permease subunit
VNQLNIIIPTIRKEWKEPSISTAYIYKFFGDATRAAAFAWIIYKSGNYGTLAYLCIGIALLSIWQGTIANSGWSLSNEIYSRTLEFALISRTSIPILLLSKILAQIFYETPSGIVAIGSILLVFRQVPQVAEVSILPLSLVLAVLGLGVLSLFLAALVVLVGGRAGFFMGIVPFGAVLGGFILPVNQLPYGLEIPARLIPTSWAMDTVWQSIKGIDSGWALVQGWGMSILLSAAWFIITYYLCVIVEKRIRVKGTLGVF